MKTELDPRFVGQGFDPRLLITAAKRRYFDAIKYEPYGSPGEPGQYAFHAARDWYRFVSWFAGARSGKSRAAGSEVSYRLVTQPKQNIWLAAPTYELGEKEFEYVYDDIMVRLPEAGLNAPRDFVVKADWNKDRGVLRIVLRNGSSVVVKSCENMKALLGAEIDDLCLCEGSEIAYAAWASKLSYRISTRLGSVMAPTTPAGINWIHDRLHIPAEEDMGSELPIPDVPWLEFNPGGKPYPKDAPIRGKKSRWTQITSAQLSPYYSEEEYSRHEKEDDEHDFQEQVQGKFVHKTGLVLSELRENRNWIDGDAAITSWGWHRDGSGRVVPPANWPRVVGMDYGESNAKATEIYAIHPQFWFVVMYWEWYFQGKQIKDQVQGAIDAVGRANTRWIVDRSAPISEYQLYGAPVHPSASNPGKKKELISHFNGGCKAGKIFLIAEQVPVFRHQAARFIWKQDPTQDKADEAQDKVRKRDDHAPDAALYGYEEIWMEITGPPGVLEGPPELSEPPWPPPMYHVPREPQGVSLDAEIDDLLGGDLTIDDLMF